MVKTTVTINQNGMILRPFYVGFCIDYMKTSLAKLLKKLFSLKQQGHKLAEMKTL